ncbi:glutamic acid-rich protein-like [Helianthus annuus]|uniref:glutamic acid-rich protein-like n=1 Tax=Helianthus annuus TaxID=4232 RepID=UPI0016531A58|nr:glutamic acid-rich protein-like [Helianthus annuus]
MKEAGYADELEILEKFKDTRNEWFVKEEKKKKSRKSTPQVQAEEGSSSQPKKRQKKNVETMLVDEPDEEEPVTNVEENQESDIDDVLKNIDYELEADKVVDEGVGADEDKSSSSSESEIDETEHSQTPPSGGRKKASARKSVVSPRAARKKLILRLPKRNIGLDEIGDFGFANDEQVKKLEKKMDDVLVENKRLVDREKILEMRVKKVESENKSLPKKIEADQTEIDILKVKVAELEEEKARRDEQNKYFELKNKELEAAKAMKEHEIYMMNKVLENMLGKSLEQRFVEIEVEEVRAKRQAEIDAVMKFKGKGVEGSEITERSIVPSTVPESPIQNPRPISAVSTIFEEYVLLEDVINDEGDDEEDDDEEDDEEDKVDDADDVFSASSHSDDGNDDDDSQGGNGVKATKASNE